MQDFLIYPLQFVFTAVMEILAVLDLRWYKQGKRKEAVILAGVIGTMGCVATIMYVQNNWLMIPDVLGLMFGTWIVMTYLPWED